MLNPSSPRRAQKSFRYYIQCECQLWRAVCNMAVQSFGKQQFASLVGVRHCRPLLFLVCWCREISPMDLCIRPDNQKRKNHELATNEIPSWGTYCRFAFVGSRIMNFQIVARRVSGIASVAQIFDHQMGVFVVGLRNVFIGKALWADDTFGADDHAKIKWIGFIWFKIVSRYLENTQKNLVLCNMHPICDAIIVYTMHNSITYPIVSFHPSLVSQIRMLH